MNSAIYHRWPLSITFPIRSALKFKSKEDFSESGPRGIFPGRVAGDLPSCHFFPTWGEAPRPRSAGRGGCGQPWPARPAPGWWLRQGRRHDRDLEPRGPRIGARPRRPSAVPHPPAASATRPGGPGALRPTAAPPRPGPGKGGAAHRSPGRKLPGAAGRSRPPRASSTRAAIFAPEPEAPSARVPLTALPPRPLPRPGRAG